MKDNMKVDYRTDIKGNYLILEAEQEIHSYQMQMIQQNSIKGILPIYEYCIDNKVQYHYDITSRQTIVVMLERVLLTSVQMRNFLMQWKDILEQMKEFLLNPDYLLLDVNYIYINLQSGEFFFCYYPRKGKGFKEGIKEVFRYFLDKVNYQDKLGVDMVYQAYQKSLQPEMDFLTICDSVLGIERSEIVQEREMEIEKEEERDKREKVKKVESVIEPQVMPEVLEDEREEKKELPIKREYIVIFFVGICSLFLAFLCYWVYQNGIHQQTIVQCIAMILIFGSILGFLFLKGKEYLKGTKIIKETQEIPYSSEEEEDISFIRKGIREVEEDRGESMLGDIGREGKEYGAESLEGDTVLLGYIEESSKCFLMPKGMQEEIIIEKFPFTIGKWKEQVDGVIINDNVSRIHARFEEIDGVYYVIDLNSKNGVYVNGIRNKIQEKVKIQNGDEIKIAALVYQFCDNCEKGIGR